MAEIKYISDFLTVVEGERQIKGYIPCNLKSGGTANYYGGPNPHNYSAMGASGVTIGTGCDLGQTDAKTLLSYGLNPLICELFTRYYGKKKDAAIDILHKHPLVISRPNAEALDHAVHGGYLNRYVIPAYNKKSKVPFDDLPKQAQAIVMSVCFQKGCGGVARDWPRLWLYLTTQNWKLAANELKTGFKQYVGRRREEGKLLEELV